MWPLFLITFTNASIWHPKENLEPLSLGTFHHPAIICDAGSTGSRVFGFYVRNNATNAGDEVEVELMGRTQVGLSVYAESGWMKNATESIIPLIRKGITRLGPTVPIYIFATGGVRQLEASVKKMLWESLDKNLRIALLGEHTGLLSMETVDGAEEALFGLISANYLLSEIGISSIHHPLESPVSVFDLGGSSLEVSLAGPDRIVGSRDDVLVSFRSLGTHQVRRKIEALDIDGRCLFGSVR